MQQVWLQEQFLGVDILLVAFSIQKAHAATIEVNMTNYSEDLTKKCFNDKHRYHHMMNIFSTHLPTCRPMPAKHDNLSEDGAPSTVYLKNCVLLLTVLLRRNMLLRNALLIDNFTKRFQTAVFTIVNQIINQFRFDRQ